VHLSYPTHYSILLSGPPGVGKFEYVLELVRQARVGAESVVLVTLDVSPREVRDRAERLGIALDGRGPAKFALVDCYSPSLGDRIEEPPPPNVFSVSGFSNLEGMGMAISRAAHEVGLPTRILFYTISTLLLHNSPPAIAKFLQVITARVKSNLGFILYAVHDGVHEPTTMSLLRSLVDGVVEMQFNDKMEREIRVHHLRGLTSSPRWERFDEIPSMGIAPGGT